MRWAFFLREALRSLSRNAMPSFAGMAAVLVTMLVLGVFIPVVQATTGAANEVRGKLLLDVYMKTTAKQSDIQRVQDRLQTKTAHVKRVASGNCGAWDAWYRPRELPSTGRGAAGQRSR